MVRRSMLALVIVAAALGCSAKVQVKTAAAPPPKEEVKPAPAPEPETVGVADATLEISERIEFETARAEIKPDSKKVLDGVAETLNKNPQFELVEIEGHTDSLGIAAQNLSLSSHRAEAVREYLISKQVDASRLVAKGFGQEKPIADNNTEDGRLKNRRVEFKIVKQAAKSAS